ncbi:MAG: glycosyltransferase family 2 protein, partial [Bacteriovoracales bacterium]|nr:glycosyltransferase family 2 protein [Bacteriovoracales bacterium]
MSLKLKNKYDLSIVVPLFNEEGNVLQMVQEVTTALNSTSYQYEIVLVNDGSTDNTLPEAEKTAKKFGTVKVISLSNNLGQGLAIHKGLESSQGQYVCFLDGDGQFDPSDILTLFERLTKDGLDFICGLRQNRKDSFFFNHLPSRAGNAFIRWMFKTNFKDVGCALKIAPRKQLL